jgi:hypothetical protein
LQLLEQLGEQYEQEHEKDLADLIRFGGQAHNANEAAFLQSLQQGTVMYSAAAAAASEPSSCNHKDKNAAEAASSAAAAAFTVPGPFSQRPRIASRLVVRDNFSVALHALCAELSSWQSGPRAMSASLLRVNLVLAESTAERHLQVCAGLISWQYNWHTMPCSTCWGYCSSAYHAGHDVTGSMYVM